MRWWIVAALLWTGCKGNDRSWERQPTTGDAIEVYQAADARKERFDPRKTVNADYLFVVDHSASMKRVLDKFNAGFARLADRSPFPTGARIAVMSTLPGRWSNLHRLHPAVNQRPPHLVDDPGFLRLVSRKSLARYRTRTGYVERFPHQGCTPWFTPGQTNRAGTPCMVAHTQIAMEGVRVEAGMTALQQLLSKTVEPVFRKGAAINVIFVSDTHDPGIPGVRSNQLARHVADLVENRPTWEDLDGLVRRTHTPASFRIHAIAPLSECSERWAQWGPVYVDAAEATGGEVLDICTADDYSGVIGSIAEQGSHRQNAVFTLTEKPERVEQVTMGGIPVEYTVDSGTGVLTIEEPVGTAEVEVIYKPADTPWQRSRNTTTPRGLRTPKVRQR